ncbi:MAG: hypothetical protein P4L33_20530 [Capsulimonadaceae bacterium]|nr:hypothetical protein [Capsulimonadaceae bacterium]
MKKIILLVAVLFCASLIPIYGADLSSDYSWNPMKIGGGGWIVGMDISPTEKGLMYCRTDVSGAYRWIPATSSWKQVVTSESMPADYVGYGRYSGVDSIVTAPKDPDIAYMAFTGQNKFGQIFRSTDRGEHWLATSFSSSRVKMDPNGEGRQCGERLAVDPANSNVAYFASVWDGLWHTDDGGKTWTKVTVIPAGVAPQGVTTVKFDKGGGSVMASGGVTKTKVIYVTVERAGVFKSVDSGATWTDIGADNGPGDTVEPRDAAVGPDRAYYVAFDKNDKDSSIAGSVWKYSANSVWTNITPAIDSKYNQGGSQSYCGIVVDPAAPRHLVVMENGGKCFVSTDGGATWIYHVFKLESSDIQWLGKQSNYWLSVGQIAFDPFVKGKLWFAEGFGVWYATDFSRLEIPWQAASEGIEEVCGNEVIAPPGGKPVGAMWDVGIMYFNDVDTYTTTRSQPNFMAAWALDWCPADPKFLVGVRQNNLGFGPFPKSSGFSTDGGLTWRLFPAAENNTLPADLEYGRIAVSANSTDHIVWAPAFSKLPYYSKDRGATWQPCSFGAGAPVKGGLGGYNMGAKTICADRVQPDTFYFYTPQDNAGVFRSTDGGATFAKAGNPIPWGRWDGEAIKATPGHAGDLWFSEGNNAGGLWHSTDGGVSWGAVPGIKHSICMGFGRAEKEGGYPTLYDYGDAGDGKTGVYRSTDAGADWERIGGFPLGIFEWVNAIDGDKDTYGTVYVAFAQAGFAYGKLTGPAAQAHRR